MEGSHNPFGTTVLLPPNYMIGAIIIWSGLISNIPAHWQLCDGTNGTADLRDYFIRGAGVDGDVRDTGGAVSHTHPFTGDGHNHSVMTIPPYNLNGNLPAVSIRPSNAVGTTDGTQHYPPYMRLAYIQRMS